MTTTQIKMNDPLPMAARRKTRRISWIIFLVIVVIAAVSAWSLARKRSASSNEDVPTASASDWFTVDRRSFDLTVLASGELVAKDQVEIKNQVEGQTQIIEIIDEGTSVKPGDVLVKLADYDIATRIEEQRLKVAQAEADQVAADQNVYIQKNEQLSNRKAAEVKVKLAELAQEKWANGDDPTKRRELQLALDKAKINVERAKRDLELSEQLFEQQFISQSELEEDKIKDIEARNALETSIQDKSVYEKYEYPKSSSQTSSDVEQAKAELDRTERKDKSEVARAEADLHAKSGTLKIYTERLEQLEKQLAATVIKAPKEGLVVYATSVGAGRRRGDPIQAGKLVRLNESLILLPDTRHMVAMLRVHEAMLDQIHIGQKVTVTIDARHGAPLEGTVVQTSVMPEDGGWINPDLREYPMRVDLPAALDGTLKPAMRCAGKVLIGRVENATAVPVQAVFTEGKQRLCYVADSDGVHVVRQPVQIGRASETLVEVISGLPEGSKVLLRRPRPSEMLGE